MAPRSVYENVPSAANTPFVKTVQEATGAAVSLSAFSTGDTVCDPVRPLQLERPVFPEPVVSMALEPRLNRDRARLALALSILSDEDPTLRTYTHPESGQSIIAGMGELHLEVQNGEKPVMQR